MRFRVSWHVPWFISILPFSVWQRSIFIKIFLFRVTQVKAENFILGVIFSI